MTTNTNAAQVANNLIAVAEDQAFEAWYKQDCLVGGVNARIAARAAWNARAALTTAAAVPPEGFVMVPVEPTPEMKAAAVKYANGTAVYKNLSVEVLRIEEGIYGEVYEAMLAARPGGHP